MDQNYTVTVRVDAGGAIENLGEIQETVAKSNTNLIALRKELKSVQSELLGLEPGTKEFDRLAKRAGDLKDRMNDVSEAVRANAGPALETIGNQASILKDKFFNLDLKGVGESFSGIAGSIKKVNVKDLTDQFAGLGKGLANIGKALLTNPIFLIGSAIALIVTNLDEVAKLIDGVSSEQEDLLEAQQKAAAASKEQLDNISQQENILRLQGKTEREILQIKEKAVDAAIEDQKLAIQTQRTILEGQVSAAKRNKEILEGLFQFITAPLQLILATIDKIAGTTLREDLNDFVSSAVFDPEEVAAEGEAALKEQEKILQQLENQRAGFLLSEKKMNQDAAAEREKIRVEEREREKKIMADILRLRESTTKLINADRESEANQRLAREAAVQKEIHDMELKSLADQNELKLQLMAEGMEKEILLSDEKFKKLRELAHGNDELLKQLAEQNGKEVDAIRAKYAEADIKREQQQRAAKLDIASSIVGSLTTIAGAFEAKNKRQAQVQFNINKALGIADATINTFKGVNQALGSAAPPFNFILAALVGAAGIANVVKISRTKFDASGGGGGSAPSLGGGGSSGGGAASTPTFNPLDNQFLNNRPPQVQAFVLAGSAQNEEENRQKIEDLSRLN